MPDDPHDPALRREASFMLAAEKSISELQHAVLLSKVQVRIIGAITAAVLLLTVASGYLWHQQVAATNQLRWQTINACSNANNRTAGLVAAFHELVVLSEGPHPDASTRKKAELFENFVKAHNYPRDCRRAYASR